MDPNYLFIIFLLKRIFQKKNVPILYLHFVICRYTSTDTVIPESINYSSQSDGEITSLLDSNKSNTKTLGEDYISDFVSLDYYNISPILALSQQSFFQTGNSPYRYVLYIHAVRINFY